MSVISIHQPHLLPWLGYFNKVMHCDRFILLDSVQYRKNYFQNRTLIKGLTGESFWLTAPVKKAPLNTLISAIEIADLSWVNKAVQTIESFYKNAPYFNNYWTELRKMLDFRHAHLAELNRETFVWACQLLGIKTEILIASGMGEFSSDPNQRLVDICQKSGAKSYIAGKGGANYLDVALFSKAGIEIIWQKFDPQTVVYDQVNGPFLPALSFIDALFNVGHVVTKEIIQKAWKPGQD